MNRLTIGKRIGLGFLLLLVLLISLGGLAVAYMQNSSHSAKRLATEYMPEADVATKLTAALAEAQLAVRSYGYTGETNFLAEAHAAMVKSHGHLDRAKDLSLKHPNLIVLKDEIAKLEPLLARYEKLVGATADKNQDLATQRAVLDASAQSFMTNVDTFIGNQEKSQLQELTNSTAPNLLTERARKMTVCYTIRSAGYNARVAVFKAQALRDPALIQEGLKNFDVMDKAFEEIVPVIHQPVNIALMGEIRKAARQYSTAMKGVMDDYIALEDLGKQRLDAALQMNAVADDIASTGIGRTVGAAEESNKKLESASLVVVVGVMLALVLGVISASLISRGVGRILSELADRLNDGSGQVVAASTQVAASSQSLAEGASEQAASLEETSSSLEEMSSMTRRNAENSTKVNELARQARTAADSGVDDMQRMNSAVQAIKASSDDIAKIIKTIDEIAFQTNILALNAAVEAARAGEAGLGFAVVAEEVRNLAQRCAQSAKETADKIEGAVSRTTEGVQISAKVAETLQEIVVKVRQVDELAAEVASASNEQQQGITQVNTAIAEMDRVTQSSAAGAEESASASEELNAQAQTLKEVVQELLVLVGHSSQPRQQIQKKAAVAPRPAVELNLEPGLGKAVGRGNATPLELSSTKTLSRRSGLPLDGDFENLN